MEILNVPTAEILKTGLLGALLIVSWVANWYLFKKVEALQNSRVEDARSIVPALEKTTIALNDNTNSRESLTRALISQTEAFQKMAATVEDRFRPRGGRQ